MSPAETMFIGQGDASDSDHILPFNGQSIVQFQLWDLPSLSDIAAAEPKAVFSGCTAVLFVVDITVMLAFHFGLQPCLSQGDYADSLSDLCATVLRTRQLQLSLGFEVFLHKADGLSSEEKADVLRDINRKTTDELVELCSDLPAINFYLTSIYDHSIFEAMSAVIQRQLPQLPVLKSLLNLFCTNSSADKAFLFDSTSRIYLATDRSPVDSATFELCSDAIDAILDLAYIYGPCAQNAEGASQLTNDDCRRTHSTVRLSNGLILYFNEINRLLSIVCLIREQLFTQPALLHYNFEVLRAAILEVFSTPL